MTRSDPNAGALMAHPVVLLALAVLVLNDHCAKALWPGFVTGKLSDFAGLVLLPTLVVASVELTFGRVAPLRLTVVAALVTGLAFALTKTWEPAAELYRANWGWLAHPFDALSMLLPHGAPEPAHRVRLVRDATDLLALPALCVPIALATWRQRTSKRMPMACGHTPSAR
jgi:hypothetical protein